MKLPKITDFLIEYHALVFGQKRLTIYNCKTDQLKQRFQKST